MSWFGPGGDCNCPCECDCEAAYEALAAGIAGISIAGFSSTSQAGDLTALNGLYVPVSPAVCDSVIAEHICFECVELEVDALRFFTTNAANCGSCGPDSNQCFAETGLFDLCSIALSVGFLAQCIEGSLVYTVRVQYFYCIIDTYGIFPGGPFICMGASGIKSSATISGLLGPITLIRPYDTQLAGSDVLGAGVTAEVI